MRKQQQDNPLAIFQQLGISANPLDQLSGLVNLINQTQAPMIQQDQFGQEMDFRMLEGERRWDSDQAQFDLTQGHYDQQQTNDDRSYEMQKSLFDQNNRFREEDNKQKLAATLVKPEINAQDNKFKLMHFLLSALSDPNGAGMIDPNVGAQYVNSGFPGLINPQAQALQSPYDSSNINKELPDEAFRQSYQKHTGR